MRDLGTTAPADDASHLTWGFFSCAVSAWKNSSGR